MNSSNNPMLKRSTNYNFIKNWGKIKQFLNDEKVKELSNKIIEKVSNEEPNINNTPLYNLGRYNDEREENMINVLDEEYFYEVIDKATAEYDNELFIEYGRDRDFLGQQYKKSTCDKSFLSWFFEMIYKDSDLEYHYNEAVDFYKQKYYKENKDDIWWFWKPIGECHNMGKLLLYLAQKVEPTENWKVQCSIAHTTVWNGDRIKPKFFDLNFFFEDRKEYQENKSSDWIPCDETYTDYLGDIFGISDFYVENITKDYIKEYNSNTKRDVNIIHVTKDNLTDVINKLLKMFF